MKYYVIYLFFILATSLNGYDNSENFSDYLASIEIANSEIPSALLDDNMVALANAYYKKPYADAPQTLTQAVINKKNYTIYRPNHGLAHALRKAALGIESALLLSKSQSKLAPWLNDVTNPQSSAYNPNFLQQLAFGMLMLRTGREAEKNDKYREYTIASGKFFAREAPKTGIFPRQKDIDDYVFAFETIGNLSKCFDIVGQNQVYTDARGCTLERVYLYNLLYGVHHLDLRRMVGFDKDVILRSIAQFFILLDQNQAPDVNSDIIKKLWERSGEYLRVTGDRDMDGKPPNQNKYKNVFYLLSSNPVELRRQVESILLPNISTSTALAPPASAPAPTPAPAPASAPAPAPASAPAPAPASAPAPVPAPNPKPAGSTNLQVTNAQINDQWFVYRARPEITAAGKIYSLNTLKRVSDVKLRAKPGTQVPWTLKAAPVGSKSLFKLSDVVVDTVSDKANKRYVLMYHGTTSELLDSFRSSAIRFDLGKGALGVGFYLTANLNEAKWYACERLKERRKTDKTIMGMVLVFGVLISDTVKGKYLVNIPLSNDKGEPLDSEIYFKRNGNLYNQFVFFANAADFIVPLQAIILPDGFSKSAQINDFDGLSQKTPLLFSSAAFFCNP